MTAKEGSLKINKNYIIAIATIGIIISSLAIYIIFFDSNKNTMVFEEIGQIETNGGSNAVKIHDNIAYIIDTADNNPGGLIFIDISNPESPSRIGNYYEDGLPWDFDLFFINDSIIALIANAINGLEIVNVTNPSQPERIAHYKAGSEIYDVQIQNNYAYVCVWNDGLEVLDLSNITVPIRVSQTAITGACMYVYLDGDRMITTNHLSLFTSILIYNITNAENPILLGQYIDNQRDFWAPQSHGIYIITGDHGESKEMLVLDISNPLDISVVKIYDFGYNNIFVNDSIAYITDFNHGLYALNIEDLNNIHQMGHFDDGGQAIDVFVVEDLVYVADRSDGLEILRIFPQ